MINPDLQILHTTCDDVLRTIALLSKTTPHHYACDELGENLHELGITLGSLDRVLRHFICDVLLAETNFDPRLALDSSLANALKLSQRTPVVKCTSLLRGGVASHLFLFSLVLRRARAAIRGASASHIHNVSLSRYVYGTTSGLVALRAGQYLLSNRPRSRSAWYAAVVASMVSWCVATWWNGHKHVVELHRSNSRLLYLLRMWTIVVNVVRQAQLRRETSYVQLASHSAGGSNPVASYHERNKSVIVRKTEVVTAAGEDSGSSESSGGGGGGGGGSGSSRRSGSGRRPSKGHAARSFLSLVAIPHDEDLTESGPFTNKFQTLADSPFQSQRSRSSSTSSTSSSTTINQRRAETKTFRGLMNVAPPPTKFAFWYDDLLADGNIVSRWGIKHGLNVLYASCRFALSWSGKRWYNTIGRAIQSCAIPYYACRPNAAASRAHQFLCEADASDIQIAWSPMMHEYAVPIALTLHAKGRIAVAEKFKMEYDGMKTESYVFSALPIDQLDQNETTVLFYFFGGGFIGNLFAPDVQFLSSWSKSLENVVIVCPQYSLCPFPFPLALNECEAAYLAVMEDGALGFHPKKCVLSGQSAGGNLAAALTIRRVQHHQRQQHASTGTPERTTPERTTPERTTPERQQQQQPSGSGRPPRPPSNSPTSPTHVLPISTLSPNSTTSTTSTSSEPNSPLTPPPSPPSPSRPRNPTKIKGLIMWYPTLNMSMAPSPSRVLFVSDVLLPLPLTNAAVQNYCPNSADAFDPCCSPVFADDATLTMFPHTYIMAAGLDPLLDDAVDFHTRLTRNKTPAKLKIWRGLPHGFLGMELVNSEAAAALSGSLDALREIVAI